MNTSNPMAAPVARRGLHPLLAAAAVCVIILCAVAVAALLGWLPTPWAGSGAQVSPEAPKTAAVAETNTSRSTPAAPAAGQVPARAATGPTLAQAAAPKPAAGSRPPPAAAPCATCGVVESIRQVHVPVEDDSNHLLGTVAGGVAGGVVGNQFGGGSGKTALTVLGAVGGALAGREIERNIRDRQTVTRYELTVRMSDGSARKFNSDQPFPYASGDHVRVENNQLLPR